jgi:lactate permease
MTDVVSGVFSVVCTALFLRFVWHPKTRFLLKSEREAAKGGNETTERAHARDDSSKYPYTARQTAGAWLPWAILIACCALWGMPSWKKHLNELFSGVPLKSTLLGSPFVGTLSLPTWEMPALHNQGATRAPGGLGWCKPEAARFVINWLSAAGTGFVAAMLSGLALHLTRRTVEGSHCPHATPDEDPRAGHQPCLGARVLTIFRHRCRPRPGVHRGGGLVPFLSAYLGWLGVF